MQQKPIVLIVDDSYTIRHLIETVLTDNGFVAVSVDSAEAALKRLQNLKPAMILLDIQLPGIDGLECCRRIRGNSQIQDVPIIFLSVHSSDVYKITALESGADDFLSKPFSYGELIARIKAILRRIQRIDTPAKSSKVLSDKLLSLDLEKFSATVEGKPVKFTLKEFNMLAVFMRSKGMVINRETLSTQVWEQEKLTTSRTIDVHIARLRKKLGKNSKVIETVGKIGYRYNPDA
jgi:DNA-binding response OmpR family regulator